MEVYKCINQIKKLGKAQSFTYVFVNMAVITAIVAAVIKCLSHGTLKTLYLVINITALFVPLCSSLEPAHRGTMSIIYPIL